MSKPKIMRFWDGKPMPRVYKDYGRMWQALNPEWEVVDYNQLAIASSGILDSHAGIRDVLIDLSNRDHGRNGIEYWVQIADVIGYLLAYEHGGIYVNTDIMPVKPLRYLLNHYQAGHNAYAGREDPQRIVNAVLGGPEKHPLYEEVLKQLPDSYFSQPYAEMVLTTGPVLLTNVINNTFQGQGIRILPETAFNSVHWKQIEGTTSTQILDQVDFAHPDLIGVHCWGHKFDGRSNVIETATQPRDE